MIRILLKNAHFELFSKSTHFLKIFIILNFIDKFGRLYGPFSDKLSQKYKGEKQMKQYAYARVSARDQNLERQIAAFVEFGIDRRCIYADKKS